MKTIDYDLIVIGAGPAGMMAAGIAADEGKKVLVLEKMKKPLLKLGITGKGRCNLTNMSDVHALTENFYTGKRFLRYSLYEFPPDKLVQFFESKGLQIKVERGNRVFPRSDKALDVVGVLKDWCRDLKIPLFSDVKIVDIINSESRIQAVVFEHDHRKEKVACKNLLIATGGKSYPKTGSTGDGYEFAKTLGHRVIFPKPALVPLVTEQKTHQLNGLKLKNVNVSVFAQKEKFGDDFGELYFTDFGVDGPVILTLSTEIVDRLLAGDKVKLSIDLKPALEHRQLENRILRDIRELKGKTIENLLMGLLPQKLVGFCLRELKIPAIRKCAEITVDERKSLENWLKNFTINIKAFRPVEEAIVTAGGVSLKEISPKTMKSKIIDNLYFAGEIINVHGKTGGFNLQAAFSTGYVAGKAVGEN